MSNNFIEKVPYEYVYSLITEISCKQPEKSIYTFNNTQFKKLKLKNELSNIIDDIKLYYKPCKFHYLENTHIYKKFITILRQLCKLHNIKYTHEVRYIHGTYNIEYYFEL
jgi:hypothetical protein